MRGGFIAPPCYAADASSPNALIAAFSRHGLGEHLGWTISCTISATVWVFNQTIRKRIDWILVTPALPIGRVPSMTKQLCNCLKCARPKHAAVILWAGCPGNSRKIVIICEIWRIG
jgi:hypothetical protein